MPDRTTLLLLACAALVACPAAAALAVDPGQPLPTKTLVEVATQAAAVPDPSQLDATLPSVHQDLGLASVNADVTAHASVHAVPNHPPADTVPAEVASASRPSVGDQIASVAAPVAASAIIASVLGAVAIGAEGLRSLQARVCSQFGRMGRAFLGLLPAVPLFSRIERSELLDNPVRARVHEVVTQDPGLSLSEVRARTGIAWGTAVHHLRRLENHGMVVSVTQLAHRRYFAADSPAASQRTAVAVVMHPTARRIAQLVSQRPGIDQTGICNALGLNNPAASKHLQQFAAQGLVLVERDGRSRLYRPTGALHSALSLLEPVPAQVRVSSRVPAAQPIAGAW